MTGKTIDGRLKLVLFIRPLDYLVGASVASLTGIGSHSADSMAVAFAHVQGAASAFEVLIWTRPIQAIPGWSSA